MSKIAVLLTTIKNDGLKIDDIKSRTDLRDIIQAMKCLVCEDGSKNERMIVDKCRFGTWKVIGANLEKIEDDLGYPESMQKLSEFVSQQRLKKLGTSHNQDDYIKALTQDAYKIETRDWHLYEKGTALATPVTSEN